MATRMQRPRVIPAELDLLDSPLHSPSMAFPSATPFSASLGLTPGSALAEHIFNDPDSWNTDEADLDLDGEMGPLADPMAWFIEEVERFRLGSAGTESDSDGSSTAFSFSPDSVDFVLDDGEETEGEEEDALDKVAFIPSRGVQADVQGIKGLKTKRKNVRPISLTAFFENAGDSLPKEVQTQLEEVLKSGRLPPAAYSHLKALSSGTLTTPSTGLSSTPSSADTTGGSISDSSSLSSPVIHSASTTLSFLEWYGIYPDSPRLDASKSSNSLRKSIYAKKTRPRLAVPMPKSASLQPRPASILSPSVLMPDLSIEAPKRGSAVPPLRELKPILEQIVVQASKAQPVKSEGQPEVTKDEGAQGGLDKPSSETEDKENMPLNPPGLAPQPANPSGLIEMKKPSTPPPPATADISPPVVAVAAEPAKSDVSESVDTIPTPPRNVAKVVAKPVTPKVTPRVPSATTPTTTSTTPSTSRTPTPPRARPLRSLAEVTRRRQLEISVKDSPPAYTRVDVNPTTATVGGSRPMQMATIRTSNSRERLQHNHPAPPATSNPIIRRLPMVPPSAGPIGSERAATPPAPPATAVPRALNSAAVSSSSRPAPTFSSLQSAHARSNSNSSNSGSKPSVHPAQSPLPSSLPTSMSSLLSPEPVYQSRPMSAMRSPMGGVMGPRSRSSTPNNGVKMSSNLARKPPVLNL